MDRFSISRVNRFPISRINGALHITVDHHPPLSGYRLLELQSQIVLMLKSNDTDIKKAAIYCLDVGNYYFPHHTERTINHLELMELIQDGQILPEILATCRAGFSPAYPEEPGYLCGYRVLEAFQRDPRLDPLPDDVLKGMNQWRTVVAVGQVDTMDLKNLVPEGNQDWFRSHHKPGTIIVFYHLKNGDPRNARLKQWQKWAKDARVIMKDNIPPPKRSGNGIQPSLFTGLFGVTHPTRHPW